MSTDQKTSIDFDPMGRPLKQPVVQIFSASETSSKRIKKPLKLDKVREQLSKTEGKEFWQSLEELADTQEFQELVKQEFPQHHAAWDPVNRRDFMKLCGAGLALAGLSACTKQPTEKIVPYVKPPEELIPGKPLFFATTMTVGGYGIGLLAENHMGRPTKIEGNPDHPASLGGTDVFAQASVLDLYDPDRSQSVMHQGRISSWDHFVASMTGLLADKKGRQGEGLRILTETVTSPTLAKQLQEFLTNYPKAQWHQYEPAGRDTVRAGSKIAFGEYVEAIYNFEKADVIVSLDADFLYTGPGHIRYAHDFASRRKVSAQHENLNRLYVAEGTPTVTGTSADHRLAVKASKVEIIARHIAHELGIIENRGSKIKDHVEVAPWLTAIVKDLKAHQGRSIVIAGEQQPAIVHALAHAINTKLGSVDQTLYYIESPEANPTDQNESLQILVNDMEKSEVNALIILGSNPVYNTPSHLGFAEKLERVEARIHLGGYANETAKVCHWHIPEAHYLESWSDARAFDGTISMGQPLIEPLYNGKTNFEILSVLNGKGGKSSHDILRDYSKNDLKSGSFETEWRRTFQRGLVKDSAAPQKKVFLQIDHIQKLPASQQEGLEIVFKPDTSVVDGRYANNGWLQEVPRPISKLTWDNAILISPITADGLGVNNEDLVELTHERRTVQGPIWVLPGQANDSITVALGYGRTRAGHVGNNVGFNAYTIQTAHSPWIGSNVKITHTGKPFPLASTQAHHSLQNRTKAGKNRNLIRVASRDEFKKHPDFAQHPHGEHIPPADMTMYKKYDYSKGEQWGMVINLNACIGCNACIVACQAENNIPIVGKKEIGNGREMHWIRIDRYYQGDLNAPLDIHHQPLTCMHCENAPCETVCPVGATMHSQDGLNQMVYNRCVGTRYCSNNCPYKVRRFNFHQFSDLKTPSKKLQRNPDVTVRVRGVMEKCTYCVQRISAGRIEAKKERRAIRDGEIVSACQQACPTNAITFGNINDPDSEVAKLKKEPLNYSLMADLNTIPRTTYLAKVKNPYKDLGKNTKHEAQNSRHI